MADAVHDAARLKELQALPLERKIQITQTRIIEWYQHYNGNVCISFSGGKDSTVLLHIARQLYPNIPAVFSNTGLEYPEIQRFVKSFDHVDIVTPSMRFDEVISTYGYPLIGKEVAEAIYYARRIRSQSVNVERERERERGWATVLDHRREFLGKRTTSSRQAERETEERYCKDDGARSRLETIGNRGADQQEADSSAEKRTDTIPVPGDTQRGRENQQKAKSRDSKWGDYHRRCLHPDESDPEDKDRFWNKPRKTEWADWRRGCL